LGNTVVKLLQELELDLNYCVGIGTDCCSVVVSAVRGAVQRIRKIAKNTIHSIEEKLNGLALLHIHKDIPIGI
jgi:hypothetical protein